MSKLFVSGAQAVYKALLHNRVGYVNMYGGGAIMPLSNEFRHGYIPYHINNHEQNCGHAATGYAKSTGRTGVVIVTSGPGLTNLVTPILDATNDSTPLVVFSGQVPRAVMGTSAFQECPATEITKSCTKWSYCANEDDDLFELTNEAFRVANNGRKGSVHIDLPKCILMNINGTRLVESCTRHDEPVESCTRHDEPVESCTRQNELVGSCTRQDELNESRATSFAQLQTSINSINYKKMNDLIVQSKCPIVYIGKGVNDYPEELDRFVKKYDLYVTSTIHSVGTFNENDKMSLGFLGMHGFPTANHAVQNADLIIAIGSRFDDRTTGNLSKYAPKCKNIIHVNIDPTEMGKIVNSTPSRIVHKLNIDCGIFLNNINQIKLKSSIKKRNEWKLKIVNWRTSSPIRYNEPANNKLNTQMVIEQINKSMNHANTIVTTGVGNHQMMSAQFIRWTHPNRLITSGSLGVMGVGLPYAIGAQMGNPDKTIIDIDGDGSFNHTSSDLQTVKRYNLPIKIFVMNDGQMSMVRAWENLFFDENYITTDCSHNPDYCALAKSFGIESVELNSKSDLKKTVEYVLNFKGPILCNVKVLSDFCFPLVAPGKALDDMITLDSYNNTKLTGDAPS